MRQQVLKCMRTDAQPSRMAHRGRDVRLQPCLGRKRERCNEVAALSKACSARRPGTRTKVDNALCKLRHAAQQHCTASSWCGNSWAGRGAQCERRSKAAGEAGISQERKGAGVPRNQQIEAEAPELVQGIVGAQEGVCLRTYTWWSGWAFRRSTQAACNRLSKEGLAQGWGAPRMQRQGAQSRFRGWAWRAGRKRTRTCWAGLGSL